MVKKQLESGYSYRLLQKNEWQSSWQKIEKTNLLQSWQYGSAFELERGWKACRILIEKANEPLAIFQVHLKTWSLFGSIARVNRGPLLLCCNEGCDSLSCQLELLDVLCTLAYHEKWRVLFVAPEIHKTNEIISRLDSLGFWKRQLPGWGSSRLSLIESEESIMSGFKGKWRNLLRKSLRSDFRIYKSEGAVKETRELIDFYRSAQEERNFKGISRTLLESLAKESGEKWEFCQYVAEEDESKTVIGYLVAVIHGDSATYLIGNVNAQGRRNSANYALLWSAIVYAKKMGCKWFDLGGLNENTPKGVAHFKSGLKGEEYMLVGELICLPWLRRLKEKVVD